MRSSWRALSGWILLGVLWATAAVAQAVPERIVGSDVFGRPLVIRALTAREVGALGAAAGVPMGFEAALTGEAPAIQVRASGKRFDAVLAEIVAADPRYEWRNDNGVYVLRPAAAWLDRANALHRNVGAIRAADLGMVDALAVTVELFGQELDPSQRQDLGDRKRFNLDLPPGTVLDALDGIVRAHGGLTWGVEPPPPTASAPGTTPSPFMVSMASAAAGAAVGIGVHLDREPRVAELRMRSGQVRPVPAAAPLDRIVGRKFSGQPLVLHGMSELPELAYATPAPMGVELLPREEEPVISSRGITVTGLRLQDALAELIAIDPRYEWRDLDGVVVVRPIAAWADSSHPLLRPIGAVHLDGVTLKGAIDVQHALLEPGLRHGQAPNAVPDLRRVSIDLAGGTHLTLVNAIARSHGAACWMYEELDAKDTAFFGGRPHQLSVYAPGGEGQGFAFK